MGTNPVVIVTWAWKGNREYTPGHVAMLDRMLKRHMSVPFQLVAFSDLEGDFGKDVEVLPIPESADALSEYVTPEGGRFPTCYRRLWLFSQEAHDMLGGRIVQTDVDVAVTGDWAHLLGYEGDFVGWRPNLTWGTSEKRLAGGMWMHETGTMTYVWDDFVKDPSQAIEEAKQAGYRGSDQAWISYKLADIVPTWPHDAGVHSIREFHMKHGKQRADVSPEDTVVVHFNGMDKPWDENTQAKYPWLKDYVE